MDLTSSIEDSFKRSEMPPMPQKSQRHCTPISRHYAKFNYGVGMMPYDADVKGAPQINLPKTMREVPATTPLSDAISKDLKKRGMSFVGSTIIYAYMQAVGIVNDHMIGCYLCDSI